jgi:hypothetical protein
MKIVEIREKRGEVAAAGGARCTNIGHEPVDRLHLADSKWDKAHGFSLTLKLEGVKRHSFFDNVPSFAGWCGVRGSSKVTFRLQNPKEGAQGSIAKRWPRRTGATC